MTLDELKKIVASGEGVSVEFKESTGQRVEACRTLCAFLNGNGGSVVFGVTNKGKITGQLVSDETRQNLARAFCDFEPGSEIAVEYVNVGATHKAIVCSTERGARRPYVYDGRPYKRKTIEAWGRGMRLICDSCAKAGVPSPVFTCDGHFVKAIFARPSPTTQKAPTIQKTTQKTIQKTIQKKVNENGHGRVHVETTEAVIDVIRAKHTVTISEMAYILGMSEIGVKYQLKALATRGRIRRVGGRKNGYWALPFEEPDGNGVASESVVKTREKGVVKTVVKSTMENSLVNEKVNDGVNEKVNEKQKEIISIVSSDPDITQSRLAKMLEISIVHINKNMKKLQAMGIIRRVGPDKGGHWEVVDVQ